MSQESWGTIFDLPRECQVNEAVMQEASIKAPPDVEGAPTGRGLNKFKSEYEKKQKEQEKKDREFFNKSQQQSREENLKAIKDNAIKFLFDRD